MTTTLNANKGSGLESTGIEKLWKLNYHFSNEFLATNDFVGFRHSKLPADNWKLILPEQQSSVIVMMASQIPMLQIDEPPKTPDGQVSFISNTIQSDRSVESRRVSQNSLLTERTSLSRISSFLRRRLSSSSSWQFRRRRSQTLELEQTPKLPPQTERTHLAMLPSSAQIQQSPLVDPIGKSATFV